ncbi:hypothetical protein C7271_04685 [filamentous cyanobacterium CCP5]|nr:hypothetical protein C7271_04685 [filamentous cyanobacterium CCP5]
MVQVSSDFTAGFLKRWTVDDYHRMIEAGILTPDDRVELLDGQIVEMVPRDPPHASRIDDGGDYLKAVFAKRAKVRVQLPVVLAPGSEPEPDFAVVHIDENRYRDRHPAPQDIFLLIEVGDSTLKRDVRKAKIYARANICEYWIVDINQQQVTILRDPRGGSYQSEQILVKGSQISPLRFPSISISLDHLIF